MSEKDDDFNFDDLDTTAEALAAAAEGGASAGASVEVPEVVKASPAKKGRKKPTPSVAPPGPEVAVTAPGVMPSVDAPTPKAAHAGSATHAYIELHQNEDIPPSGLPIGLNGKHYELRPGVPARVPVGVIGVLKAAVAAKPVRNPSGKITSYRESPRFPYTVLTQAEFENNQ